MKGRASACPTTAVAVCTATSCRRRDGHTDLCDLVASRCELVTVGCVGVCSGPVAVVIPADGEPVVVERLRSGKARRDLGRLVLTGDVSDRLRRRMVGPSKAAKAVRRARRTIARGRP